MKDRLTFISLKSLCEKKTVQLLLWRQKYITELFVINWKLSKLLSIIPSFQF